MAIIRHVIWGLLATAWPLLSYANCVDGRPSPEQEFRASDAVIVGPIVGRTVAATSATQEGGTIYTVRVQEALRGNPGKTMAVFSGNGSSQFPMKKGRTYILFIRDKLGLLQVDNCGNSGPLPERDDVLASIRKVDAR